MCYEDPVAPKKLACGHILCTGCVKQMVDKAVNKTCPLCRGPLPALPTAEQLWDCFCMLQVRMVKQLKRSAAQSSLQCEMEEMARQMVAIAPRDVRGHFALGYVLAEKGDVDGAIASYRAALAIDPNHALARQMLADQGHPQISAVLAAQFLG